MATFPTAIVFLLFVSAVVCKPVEPGSLDRTKRSNTSPDPLYTHTLKANETKEIKICDGSSRDNCAPYDARWFGSDSNEEITITITPVKLSFGQGENFNSQRS